jgi:hypothetical protein
MVESKEWDWEIANNKKDTITVSFTKKQQFHYLQLLLWN